MLGEKVQELFDSSEYLGKLPSYSSYGSYPIFYVNDHNDILCSDCANEHNEYDETIVEYDANWEDSSMYCDHCSKRIESAYAEDNVV